jgi:hypothetical protein
MKVITFNPEYNIPELKDKIRAVIREHTKTHEDIHISVVYYEVKTYKKPKEKKHVRKMRKKK